jgi:hypothetical protein
VAKRLAADGAALVIGLLRSDISTQALAELAVVAESSYTRRERCLHDDA